jgi:hypothetical protein
VCNDGRPATKISGNWNTTGVAATQLGDYTIKVFIAAKAATGGTVTVVNP